MNQVEIYQTHFSDVCDSFTGYSFVGENNSPVAVYVCSAKKLKALIPAVSLVDSLNHVAVIETSGAMIGDIEADGQIPLPNFTAAISAALTQTEKHLTGQKGISNDEILTSIKTEMIRCLALSADA